MSGWMQDPRGVATAAAAAACVQRHVAGRIALDQRSPTDSLGLVRFGIQPRASERRDRPQPTTMLGYELIVSVDDRDVPSTRLRVAPGEIPNLRLRVTPVLPTPGTTITAELIRGPSFSGELPHELQLDCMKSHPTAKLDAEHHAALAIPAATEGWCSVTGGGQRALVYVRPQADLAVTVQANDRYRPGEQAQLFAIRTPRVGRQRRSSGGRAVRRRRQPRSARDAARRDRPRARATDGPHRIAGVRRARW